MAYDMLTNEGHLALSRAVSTGYKLYIEGAVLMRDDPVNGFFNNVATAAQCTWSALPNSSDYKGSTDVMPAVSYLPSQVTPPENGEPAVSALDMEFSYVPSGTVEYNLVAVRARMYYEMQPLAYRDYAIGDIVSIGDASDGITYYYKCIEAFTRGPDALPPASDSTHWEEVSVDAWLPGAENYCAITDDYILLYVSRLDSTVTLGNGLEIDYKLRLFLENANSAEAVKERIYFDTLGPEMSQGVQCELLAYFAQNLRDIRDIAMSRQ